MSAAGGHPIRKIAKDVMEELRSSRHQRLGARGLLAGRLAVPVAEGVVIEAQQARRLALVAAAAV